MGTSSSHEDRNRYRFFSPFFFPLNFYDGHRDFFTKHYFYTILSLLPNYMSHEHSQCLHPRASLGCALTPERSLSDEQRWVLLSAQLTWVLGTRLPGLAAGQSAVYPDPSTSTLSPLCCLTLLLSVSRCR